MRRALAAAIGLVLIFGAVGCDEDGSNSAKADKDGQRLVASPAPDQVPHPALYVGATPTAETLKDAPADLPQTPPTDKASLDRLFDHNLASGDVAVAPAGAVQAPSAQAMSDKARRVKAALAASAGDQRGKSGAADQPKGKTLPAVPLPDASAAVGDPDVRGGGPVLVAFDAFMKASGLSGKVFSRAFWGAGPSTALEGHQDPTRVTIHHTDSARQTMTVADSRKVVKGIQAFHQGPDRRWGDIGYHFIVDGGGNVFEGRHADVIGAHVWKHNQNNIGIANIGDYNRDQLTDAQKETLKRLISFLALKYKTDPSQQGFIEGHRHFTYNDTDCPGKNIVSFLPELRRLVDQDASDILARSGQGFVPLVITYPNPS